MGEVRAREFLLCLRRLAVEVPVDVRSCKSSVSRQSITDSLDQDFSRHFHLIYSTALHHWCSGDIHNLDAYKRALLDHNAYVRKRVPKERLLEWSVTEGWEPLCKFLDKDVPDTPFPRVNEGEGLRKMLDMVFLQRMITVLPKAILTVTLPVALGFGAWMLYQKMIV